MKKTCELCGAGATVYCDADVANLCWTCDAKVHGANFLVVRHIRSLLCSNCGEETECQTAGAHPSPLFRRCGHCDPSHVDEVAEEKGLTSSEEEVSEAMEAIAHVEQTSEAKESVTLKHDGDGDNFSGKATAAVSEVVDDVDNFSLSATTATSDVLTGASDGSCASQESHTYAQGYVAGFEIARKSFLEGLSGLSRNVNAKEAESRAMQAKRARAQVRCRRASDRNAKKLRSCSPVSVISANAVSCDGSWQTDNSGQGVKEPSRLLSLMPSS